MSLPDGLQSYLKAQVQKKATKERLKQQQSAWSLRDGNGLI